jgi:hypothetical protein
MARSAGDIAAKITISKTHALRNEGQIIHIQARFLRLTSGDELLLMAMFSLAEYLIAVAHRRLQRGYELVQPVASVHGLWQSLLWARPALFDSSQQKPIDLLHAMQSPKLQNQPPPRLLVQSSPAIAKDVATKVCAQVQYL